MTRAAIYARYSSDLQDERSIARQVADLRAEAGKKGWEIAAVFTDEGISGESLVLRPGVQALIAGARARRFEIVLTEAIDRLARNEGHSFNLYDELTFCGVEIYRPTKGVATKTDIFVEGLVAAQQMEGHRAKVRSGQREAVRRGRSAGGLSYGYAVVKDRLDERGDPVRGLRRIDEAEAAIVRRIFAEYAAGVTPSVIIDRLNAERVPAPNGGLWNVSMISGHRARGNGILHNRLYIGDVVYNRVRMVKDPRTGKRLSRANPERDWQITRVEGLRIVDDETWRRAQALKVEHGAVGKSAGAAAGARQQRPRQILSGLARCGVCGDLYAGHGNGVLRCSRYANKRACKNTRRIDRARLEARVLEEIATLLEDPDMVAAAIKEYHDERRRLQTAHGAARRGAAKEIADAGGKIARLMALVEAGAGENVAELAARLKDLSRRKAAAEAALAAADEELKVVDLAPDAAEIYRHQVAEMREGLFGEDGPDRATAMAQLRGLISAVNIHPLPEAGRFRVVMVGKIDALFTLTNDPRLAREPSANKLGGTGGSGGPRPAVTPTFKRSFVA